MDRFCFCCETKEGESKSYYDEGELMEDKEEFSFIEEEVMQSKKKQRQLFGRVRKAAVSGIVFGITASCGFCAVQAFYMGITKEKTPNEIALTVPTEEVTVTEKPKREKDKIKTEEIGIMGIYNFQKKFSKLANQSKRFLVGVAAYDGEEAEFYEDTEQVAGLVVAQTDKAVFIFTNYSVVKGKEKIYLNFSRENSALGTIYSFDSRMDFAILKVAKSQLTEETAEEIQVATMGESNLLSIGDMVFAFGCPTGKMYSAEYGYITSEAVVENIEDYQLHTFSTSMNSYRDSTGIVCNQEGEIVGILSPQANNNECGQFYGISKLKYMIEELLNKKEQCYAGIIARDIPENVLSGHSLRSGVYVEAVADGSPAYKADIFVGEVIVSIEGEEIHTVKDYYQCLQKYEADDKIVMTVAKDPFVESKERKTTVKLIARNKWK